VMMATQSDVICFVVFCVAVVEGITESFGSCGQTVRMSEYYFGFEIASVRRNGMRADAFPLREM